MFKTKPDTRPNFDTFINAFVELGFGEADPELMLFYTVMRDDTEALKNLLKKEGWKSKKYNINITDTELVRRYESLLSTSWVKEKMEEVSAR